MMPIRDAAVLALLAALCLTVAACTQGRQEKPALQSAAEKYVRLALDIGQHDEQYVDAYYGPAEWKEEAKQRGKVPLDRLLEQAAELLAELREAEPSGRRDYLEKQVVAAEAFIRRHSGETMTLAQEAKLLFDIEPEPHSVEEFVAAHEKLEDLLPGDGPLIDRVKAFRDRFIVPPDRLPGVLRASLEECRKRTAELVTLPKGESFRSSFVQDQPWSAYNWYKGNLHSLIEVNTDLPIELARFLGTLSHESYPGHHTYNILLEDRLVKGKGWVEFTVSPLYAPQAVISEGTAENGLSVIMTKDEQWEFMEKTLAPVAGLEDLDFDTYRALLDALQPLRYVSREGARMLLDEGKDEEEVIAFLARYQLRTEDRARKWLDFARGYRSYVYTYTVGEDLVGAYIGDGPDRAERFFDILQRPVTPSELRAD